MKPKIVFLTESEIERARRIADVRNSKCNQVPNYRETRVHSDWQIHFVGVCAEMAVCKAINFPIDSHFSYHGDSKAPDLYWSEMRVEVKAATHKPPILKMNLATDFVSDLVVLCYVEKSGAVEIYGGVSRLRFARDHYVKDFGYGPRACFDCDKLTSMEDIAALIKKTQET